MKTQLFDEWPEYYDRWFTSPIGKMVKEIESELIYELLEPGSGEEIIDVGCGTGVFTHDLLIRGARVIGLDISSQMLRYAVYRTAGYPFSRIQGDMLYLPFKDNSFDKSVSITALEFIADARTAVNELFRVTRPGGYVVVATLNSLSLWADRRNARTSQGQKHILQNAIYRSPQEVTALSQLKGVIKTTIHFEKDDSPDRAMQIEQSGKDKGLNTGAFVAVRWQKPPSI